MSIVRLLVIAITALLVVPASARAEEDDNSEICTAWTHVFEDGEVDGDSVTFSYENKCLMYAGSLDGLEISDGNPFNGGPPEVAGDKQCDWLVRHLFELRSVLAQARAGLPAAIAARDAADTKATQARVAYEAARDAWQRAQAATNAAKAAYDAVYKVDVATERDAYGHVVLVVNTGYSSSTTLGRAVHDAIQKEAAAKQAMDAAWTKWTGATTVDAGAAQFRVDQYESVLHDYPAAIDATEALISELGCK